MRSVLLMAMLAGTLASVWACGSGGDDNDNSQAQRPGTALQATPPGPTPVLEGISKEFADLLDQGLTATYKVIYETASPTGGQGDTFVIYSKPPLTRIDTIPAGSADASSLLIGGDQTTPTLSCSAGSTGWECAEIAPLADRLVRANPPFSYLTTEEIANYDVTETAAQTFAGQEARCFALRPAEATEQPIEYCFNQAEYRSTALQYSELFAPLNTALTLTMRISNRQSIQ